MGIQIQVQFYAGEPGLTDPLQQSQTILIHAYTSSGITRSKTSSGNRVPFCRASPGQ